MSLANSTIAALRQRLLAKEISPRDIVTDVAKAIDAQNASIGAYLSWNLEKALKEADKADEGHVHQPGPMHERAGGRVQPQGAQAHGQERVQSARQLADQPGAQEQLMGNDLGVRRGFLQSGNERLGPTHV